MLGTWAYGRNLVWGGGAQYSLPEQTNLTLIFSPKGRGGGGGGGVPQRGGVTRRREYVQYDEHGKF